MKKIRILIVDDHTVVRGGLRLFLLAFPDLELIGEASSGEMALELCKLQEPDVVIMDILMPGMNGIDATHQIRTKFPATQVIALTSFPDDQLVRDAINAGAAGFLLKTTSAKELVEAIRAVEQGKSVFSPEAEKILAQRKQESYYHDDLTKREWEIYRLVMVGKNNGEIAQELVISVSTVKYHVSNILSKLGVKNRAEAIAYAVQHRLVD
jgi:NarL family two-component system response regulator LiaR